MEFKSWVANLRDAQQLDNSPVSLNNGIWSIKHRKQLWEQMASIIYDDHLDKISELAYEVLTEIDPQFELPADKRYASKVYGKALKHSDQLRRGLAETLALIGAESEKLVNCSTNKRESTAPLCVRKILNNADWKLWGSLSNLLSTLAEAAPNEFLNCVETALRLDPCPFDELFNQESDGVGGRTYFTGILWALEALAWSETYLARVNIILAELAAHDPGGSWANRPINSLKTILMPWLPQTLASAEKRLSSVKAIKRDFPDIAWRVITSMLPNQHQTSSGTNKPQWRGAVPEDFKITVMDVDYWKEVSAYIELAIDIAEVDIQKLVKLTKELDHLGLSYERVLSLLSSDQITKLPEVEKTPIWKNLIEFTQKHKRFPDSNWALNGEIISKIEEVASKLAPTDKLLQYERLFGNNDWDLSDEIDSDDYEIKRLKFSEKREQAITEIYRLGGLSTIINFVNQVQSPYNVGLALSVINNSELTTRLLPSFFSDSSEKIKQLVRGFLIGAFSKYGWDWVDSLNLNDWDTQQKVELLCCLPFETKTLDLAKKLLGNNEYLFWEKVWVNPYHTDADLIYIVDKLLEVKRINAAIHVLYYRFHESKGLDIVRSVKALLSANNSIETSSQMDSHYSIELIKALQKDPNTPPQDLFNVEWFYIPLLDDSHGHHPVFLQKKLAQDPEFFCQLMNMIYKPTNADESYSEPDQEQRNLATNAWSLIHIWKTPPGQDGEEFDENVFKQWVKEVKELSAQNDRLDISMQEIGKVFYYYPQNEEGLWLPNAVAEVLDGKDAEHIRIGYIQEIYNSRGVHWVDPEGKPELALANKWQKRAEIAEQEGYPRFAAKLRERAESYKRDAQSIIDEHSSRNKE